jgi:hypothetical protein
MPDYELLHDVEQNREDHNIGFLQGGIDRHRDCSRTQLLRQVQCLLEISIGHDDVYCASGEIRRHAGPDIPKTNNGDFHKEAPCCAGPVGLSASSTAPFRSSSRSEQP